VYSLSRVIVEIFEQPNFAGRKAPICDTIKDISELGFVEDIGSAIVYQGPKFKASPNDKAIFFEKPDFQGEQLILAPGYYTDLHNGTYNLPTIRSIKFGTARIANAPYFGQIPVVLELYEGRSFKGVKALILQETPNTEQLGLPSQVFSLILRKGPDFPRTGCKVIFYEQPNFTGSSLPVELRSFTPQLQIPDLMVYSQKPLTVGSIQIAA